MILGRWLKGLGILGCCLTILQIFSSNSNPDDTLLLGLSSVLCLELSHDQKQKVLPDHVALTSKDSEKKAKFGLLEIAISIISAMVLYGTVKKAFPGKKEDEEGLEKLF